MLRKALLVSLVSSAAVATATAQTPSASGYYTDPDTGIVYQQVTRTIERPVTQTRIEKQTQTVFRPETVTESRPSTRTVYTPIVEHNWEPRVHGRWNPFQRPTIAYHHVPRTRWEARAETVQQTSTRTQWVPENRTVEVPRQTVSMRSERQVDYEPVGRVAPPAKSPQSAIAARLKPLEPGARIDPMPSASTAVAYAAPSYLAPRIAATTIGRMTSDPPRRGIGQRGLRATELAPIPAGNHGSPLPIYR